MRAFGGVALGSTAARCLAAAVPATHSAIGAEEAARACRALTRMHGKESPAGSVGFAADAGATSATDDASKEAEQEPRNETAATDADEEDWHQRRKREDQDKAHSMTQRLLNAAMKHVTAGGGWTETSLRRAAADLGYSPAVVGQLPRGVGSLVEHFVEECDSRLSVQVSTRHDELAEMSAKERVITAIQWRLAMIEPLIESWPAAVAIQASPENIPASLRQRSLLADEICSAAGPGFGLAHVSHSAASGGFELAAAGWYSDRASIAALYSACELFMLTDTSPNFTDTKVFVEKRVSEMAEVAKTVEEVGGFAAMAAKGLPGVVGGGSLPFPPLPFGGREALEELFGKVASAMPSRQGKK